MHKQDCTWTIAGNHNHRFIVRLMHSTDSGNLLLYCNKDLLYFDTNVVNSSKYSFFLDEELCEVHLDRQGGFFHYSFQINKNAATERNNTRKIMDKKYKKQMYSFFGGLAIMVILGLVAGRYMDAWKYKKHGEEFRKIADSVTYVILNTSDNGSTYVYHFKHEDKSRYKLPNNLKDGAAYKIYYFENSPNSSWIDFEAPVEDTTEREFGK
jgi:hypothetical protein